MISDTTPEMEQLLLAMRRKQTSGQRMSNALELCELVRSLEIGVLRIKSPGVDEIALRFNLAEKRHGLTIARQMFGVRVMTA